MTRPILIAIFFLLSLKAFAAEELSLLPHQTLPVEYLYTHEQKGLLIAHSFGSGKTLLGLGFAEKYPERPILIMVPYFLKSHWDIFMERYGIKGKPNYTVVTYEEAAEKLVGLDLENTIVIMDEAHKLISWVRSADPAIRQRYLRLYLSISKAFKLLLLTGTPLYQDVLDLSYILNLTAGETILPFNYHQFQVAYMKINPGRALWRGYLAESLFVQLVSVNFITANLFAFSDSLFILKPIIPIGWLVLFPLVRFCVPLDTYRLRTFHERKLKAITTKYVSFYEVPVVDKANYPTVDFVEEQVELSNREHRFLLNFIDRGLNKSELQLLVPEASSQDELDINSTLIQEHLLQTPGVGREISNIIFKDSKGRDVYPEKFKRLLEYLNKGNYPVVIYSNYYRVGILNLAQFLDQHGYKGKYKILNPSTPISEQVAIINDYNQRKLDILLLHPDITEGISLVGTQEFHLLEQVNNSALLSQIVGRAVRYHSHTHLPKEKQTVHVITWKAILSTFNCRHLKVEKQNWRQSFSELNVFSNYGFGRLQIDKNNTRKTRAPDEDASNDVRKLDEEMVSLRNLFKAYSIESRP